MRKIILSFVLVCFGVSIYSQTPEWENPEVFQVNKENYRSTFIPYPNTDLATKDNYAQSPFFMSLDGIWKFNWVEKPSKAPTDFYKEGYNVSDWANMPVPGNWEFNGFGTPIYTNTKYPFPINVPYVDNDNNPVGSYVREFELPQGWDNRKVFIHFEGGAAAMYLWINGQKVGYTENAKSPAEFDITQYVRKGKNTVACQIYKYGDGSYLEDQDMWRLAGLNRSVYLYTTDNVRISDFFAHPDLDSNYKNGMFSIDVDLKNYKNTKEELSLEISILDAKNKSVFNKSQLVNVAENGVEKIALEGKINNPLKWTAETPNLYTLLLTLKSKDKKTIEVVSHKIGFRKIEITDGQVFINGQKVYFKGVNLHEYNYKTGQVVNEEVMMRNIQLMKELNINAVRTSHYPQPPLWYKLCDQYGLYLVDEANLESHGLGFGEKNVSNFPEWNNAHMDRIKSVVERDKNHASVIFWSLGNEASNGPIYFEMYDWAKLRDPSRPTQYEQARKGERNTDVICPMYPSWESMQRDAARDIGRPYVMCEYAHAMGNSMGNFQEYWDLMRSSKNMQGGFIWEWHNHGYPTKDEQGRSYWAYGGDLGGYDMQNDGNFCMDGVITPDQQLMPHSHIVKKVYQDILFKEKDLDKGIITVINDFKFTDITKKSHTFKWVLLHNGKVFGEGDFIAEVKANQQKDIKLALPNLSSESGSEYFLQVYAYLNEATPMLKYGFEVAKEEFAMSINNYFVAQKRSGNIEIDKSSDKVSVTSKDLIYEFSLKDGATLTSMTHKGEKVFKTLPRPNFWRAPTDNDFGSSEQYNLRIWDYAGYNIIWKYKGLREENGTISFTYEGKLRGVDALVNVQYTVQNDGSLTINTQYKALSDELPELMRFGMLMSLTKDKENFTWYGRGPHENYVDRKQDAFMGVWEGLVKDQAYPYYRPQETGNKTDVRWLTLTNEEGEGILIEGDQALSVSALNNYPEDFDPGTTKKQQHWSDIIPRNEVVLCVDLFQRGLAGLDSWRTKPFDNYRFRDKEYSFTYTISLINNK